MIFLMISPALLDIAGAVDQAAFTDHHEPETPATQAGRPFAFAAMSESRGRVRPRDN